MSVPHSKPLVGIALMVAAMLVMPFLDVVAKFLGQQNVPIMQIVWARLFFGMAMTAPFVLQREGLRGLIPQQPHLHVARAVLLIAATGLFFWGLKYQGIAECLSIFFVQPLVVTMLSPLVLGEKVGLRRWLAVVVGFLATLIIIRPGFQAFNPGMLMALGAGFCAGIYLLISRILAGSSRALPSTFYTSLIGAIFASIIVSFVWKEPTTQQWLMFPLLAFFATFGNFLAISALEHAEASLLAPLGYTEMIMAVAAGWYFFNDFPDGWTFAGVGILIACAIYISYRERVQKVPMGEMPSVPLT
jgi:drug/metabolite transporter (DMT)-like permease